WSPRSIHGHGPPRERRAVRSDGLARSFSSAMDYPLSPHRPTRSASPWTQSLVALSNRVPISAASPNRLQNGPKQSAALVSARTDMTQLQGEVELVSAPLPGGGVAPALPSFARQSSRPPRRSDC